MGWAEDEGSSLIEATFSRISFIEKDITSERASKWFDLDGAALDTGAEGAWKVKSLGGGYEEDEGADSWNWIVVSLSTIFINHLP